MITILLAIIALALLIGGRNALNVILWLVIAMLIIGAIIGILTGAFWLIALIVFGAYQYSAEVGGFILLVLGVAGLYGIIFIASKIDWFGSKKNVKK